MRPSFEAGIYYTGDMTNSSGHFRVTNEGRTTVTLTEINGEGRIFHGIFHSQIGEVYQGTCDPRFVTKYAYQAYRIKH